MVVIRLARAGAKKRPFYHITVADRRAPRDGRFIEQIGFFNPIASGQAQRLRLDLERVDHWISVGAKPSSKVASIIKQYRIEQAAAEANAAEANAAEAEAEEASQEAVEEEPSPTTAEIASDEVEDSAETEPSAEADAESETKAEVDESTNSEAADEAEEPSAETAAETEVEDAPDKEESKAE